MDVYQQFVSGLLFIGNLCFAAFVVNAVADGWTEISPWKFKPFNCIYCMSFYFSIIYCFAFNIQLIAGFVIWSLSLIIAAKLRS